jgi:hypothetical protein
MSRFIGCVLVAATLLAGTAYGQLYEAHYLFRGGHPIGQTGWSFRVEGVAHDDNFWYFTKSRLPATQSFHAIWKVPVGLDLLNVTINTPGVSVVLISNVHPLSEYTDYGDPDVYRFNGVDYLVVPVSRYDDCFFPPAAVAFFRCDTLAYLGYARLPGPCGDAPWVAVNEAGELFSSRTNVGLSDPAERGLRVYDVDWAALSNPDPVTITFNRTVPMFNESNQPLVPGHMQGGEFAPGGQLLYLSSGFFDDDNATADSEGIHVIDTTTFRRVRHSTRGVAGQLFDFYYNPGGSTEEQPQGLTLWDLDDGRAPGILGQLHVLVGENFFETVDFKHFTRALSVDPNGPGCQTGTPSCPFHTISAALDRAWDGAEIRIHGGSYPNPMSVSRRIVLSSQNGTVRIGG